MQNYMYIIVDIASRRAAIVDPAWDLELITNLFSELEVEPAFILLTHSHFDHVNMVEPLVERYGSSVYMSEKECNYYHYDTPHLERFHDMDMLYLGDTKIQCFVTPGHTAGGSCFLLSGDMFTGDTLFTEGCGVCHMEGGSADRMFESFQRLKRLIDPNVRIFPGHSYGQSPGCMFGELQKYNIYIGLDVKKHFVDFRMRKNQKPFIY